MRPREAQGSGDKRVAADPKWSEAQKNRPTPTPRLGECRQICLCQQHPIGGGPGFGHAQSIPYCVLRPGAGPQGGSRSRKGPVCASSVRYGTMDCSSVGRAGRPVQCGYSASTVRAEGAARHSTAHHSTAAAQGWRWHGWAACGALLPHLETRAPSASPGQAKPGKASAEHTALGIEREMQHEA
ncbi:hypothetical protein BKA56DRAFT_607919 [Ilyonectria sp. MPI-CAGE-AT-0026]|nr:hypothetical protein BKA56DRAFT_607919 [Ilyonectria sp. MPI-CAGE-AT-0026]